MLIYLPHSKVFDTRKDVKEYLGGTNKYNRALKQGEIFNITNTNIAHNGTIYYSHQKNQ